MIINITIGISYIFIGLLVIGFAIPLIKRKVKMNSWYGVKIKKAYESEERWYEINEYGGRILVYWSIPLLISGVIALFLPPLKLIGTIIFDLIPLIIILISFIQILNYANKV